MSSTIDNDIRQLAAMVQNAKHPVVLTGAGISVASGISTFRGKDTDAVWKHTTEKQVRFQYTEDPTEIGTYSYFVNDPVKSWYWYYTRFSSLLSKKPNPAHKALIDLQDYCKNNKKSFDLITQNIDGLHRKAGSEDCIEIHGRVDRVRCINFECDNAAPNGSLPLILEDFKPFIKHPSQDTIPKCPACNSLLRPHVLWFDEYYTGHVDFQFQRASTIFEQGDILIFIGTSLAVGITYNASETFYARKHPIWLIDPNPVDQSINLIKGNSEEVLPQLIHVLQTSS